MERCRRSAAQISVQVLAPEIEDLKRRAELGWRTILGRPGVCWPRRQRTYFAETAARVVKLSQAGGIVTLHRSHRHEGFQSSIPRRGGLLGRAHLLKLDQQQNVVDALDNAAD